MTHLLPVLLFRSRPLVLRRLRRLSRAEFAPLLTWFSPVLFILPATGWVIFWLWGVLGLPNQGSPGDAPFPALWRWFFAVWPAALFGSFTLFHSLLFRINPGYEGASSAAETGLRWDRRSYALLPVFVLLMLGWSRMGGDRLPLSALFVAVVFAKGLLVVVTLWRAVFRPGRGGGGPPESRRVSGLLFLTALLPYAFLIPYVITAVSAGGDEPAYLLGTHSLYADGELDARDDLEAADYRSFYWASPRPSTPASHSLGFPAFLLPGYALAAGLLPGYPLAGRLGATLTIGLCAALLGVQVYWLCRELGASRPAAFWAWLILALTPPMIAHSSHVYPEIPAALVTVGGVRALLRIPERLWPALLTVAGAAGLLVLLKDRYAPLAIGLVFWALVRMATRRPVPALVLVTGVLGVGLYVVSHDPLPWLFPNLHAYGHLGPTWLGWAGRLVHGTLGLFADQEFGLFFYGPHWLLGFVGLPFLWRRHRWTSGALLGLISFYVIVLLTYRADRWYGGWTPPPRFALPVAVLMVPFVAAAFDHARGRLLAAANTVWLLWSGAAAFLLTLVPLWRYNNADGRTTLLQLASLGLDLDLTRVLPSLIAPTGWSRVALLLGALCLVGSAVAAARRPRRSLGGWGIGTAVIGPVPAGILAGTLAMLWVLAVVLVPTGSVEAEAMRHSAGAQFSSFDSGQSVWALVTDAELAEPILTWPGVTEIVVVAGAYTTTAAAPRMALVLDDRPVGAWALRAGVGDWVRGRYLTRVRMSGGRVQLRLELSGLLHDEARGRFQHAYVDRIRLRRVGGPPNAGQSVGCGTHPVHHCPDAPVTRLELAKALATPRRAAAFRPLSRGNVADGGTAALRREGSVSRAIVAVALLAARHGHSFRPPPPRGTFRDVPATHWAASWIEALAAEGITHGCGPRRYCPESAVTWGQLTAFLRKTFPGWPAEVTRRSVIAGELFHRLSPTSALPSGVRGGGTAPPPRER